MAAQRREGTGRTLEEAFDNYARRVAQDLLAEHGESTLNEALVAFDEAWHPVEIAVQVRPHNQWPKAYRVSDR
jgi:hypothetical protein